MRGSGPPQRCCPKSPWQPATSLSATRRASWSGLSHRPILGVGQGAAERPARAEGDRVDSGDRRDPDGPHRLRLRRRSDHRNPAVSGCLRLAPGTCCAARLGETQERVSPRIPAAKRGEGVPANRGALPPEEGGDPIRYAQVVATAGLGTAILALCDELRSQSEK
jgi:hypothetical protein